MKQNTYYLSSNMLQIIKNDKLRSEVAEFTTAFNKLHCLTEQQLFRIGVMGKSGAGKSTIINSLCQDNICKTGGSRGVTRNIQRIKGKLGDMQVRILDFPGIAESQEWDKEYIEIYKTYLDKLDLILWTIKIDDRAIIEDEKFCKRYIFITQKLREKCIFVLTQSDKSEPIREWDNVSFSPSPRQKETIMKNHVRLVMDLDISEWNSVIHVACSYEENKMGIKTYNFDAIFEAILFKLDTIPRLSSTISTGVNIAVTVRRMNKTIEMSRFAAENRENIYPNIINM
ncbi:GTPase family protein [Aggregatibacter actinomycetemcomitans]|uniref:GTPase family protein n=1 Tax=Aggregatibacter actinomycetemcomitans TaxID=714 RepID=UPI001E63DD27|nr:GTPase [Aggregatibacter actinomycetemcomitans]